MRITKKLLEKHDACSPQVELFEELFPRGAEVNIANMMLADAAGLDTEWVHYALADDAQQSEFRRLYDELISPLERQVTVSFNVNYATDNTGKPEREAIRQVIREITCAIVTGLME